MDRLQAAEQFRKALQMYAQTLTDEQAMEIATMAFDGETTEEVKERYGDEFYSVFLIQTDHIPNKILSVSCL